MLQRKEMGNLDSAEGKERAATADVGNAGEFVMRVSFYGAPPGWWITVEV